RCATAARETTDEGDRLLLDRYDERAGGGLHAARVPARLDGTAVERVRDRRRRSRRDFGIRGPHVDADAVRLRAAGAARAWRGLQDAGARVQCPRRSLREAAPDWAAPARPPGG